MAWKSVRDEGLREVVNRDRSEVIALEKRVQRLQDEGTSLTANLKEMETRLLALETWGQRLGKDAVGLACGSP